MGIAFQNLGTAPNQSTFTQDVGSATKLLSSGQFAGYLQQEIYEQSAMVRSGLLATDARLSNIQGVIAEMPFAAPLDYNEEVVNSGNTWGDNGEGFYTIQRTQASTQYAPIVTRGAAFGMDDLSQVQTGFDALANIRSQLATDMNRKITAKIISQLNGLFLDTTGAGGGPGPLSEHVVATGNGGTDPLTATDIIRAKSLLGESAGGLQILIVHPDVKHHLENLGMTVLEQGPAGIAPASNGIGITSTEIGYFAGMRVISDSQVPVDPNGGNPIYTSYMAAPGVIRTGAQFPILIETERNKLSLQDSLIVTYNRVDHVVGTSWTAGAFASDPTNAQLADPVNWSQAYLDTRLIPLLSVQSGADGMASLVIPAVFAKHPEQVIPGDFATRPVDGPAAGRDGDTLGGPFAAAQPAPAAKTTKSAPKKSAD